MPTAPPPIGELHVVDAPASWRAIDFISDLHLAEDTPLGFAAWSDYLVNTSADAVFMLGDLFEIWVGDDSAETGFEARCAEVLRQASNLREIGLMVGNRDFLVGARMRAASGLRHLPDPTLLNAFSRRALLSHGDALCIDDVAYQRLRATLRQADWQSAFLSRPLAERRAAARQMRAESQRTQAARPPEEWFDVDRSAGLAWLAEAGADTLIHGHTHRPATELLAPGITRHVLSDWEFDHAPRQRGDVLRWSASGFERLTPAEARA